MKKRAILLMLIGLSLVAAACGPSAAPTDAPTTAPTQAETATPYPTPELRLPATKVPVTKAPATEEPQPTATEPAQATAGSTAAPTPTSPPADEALDWHIVPGERVGPITAGTTIDDLVEIYGQDNVQQVNLDIGEGESQPGALILRGTKNAAEILWREGAGAPGEAGVQAVRLHRQGTDWRTESGVAVGTTLAELEGINGRPFMLSGFETDYPGTRLSWEDGNLPDALEVWLSPTQDVGDDYEQVIGDGEFASDHPVIQKMDLVVGTMIVGLEPSAQDLLTAQPWEWAAFYDAEQEIEIEDPEKYVATFMPDGTLQVQADCNQTSGTYTVTQEGEDAWEGGPLSIEIGPMTRAMCPPGSRSEGFVQGLSAAARHGFLEGTFLRIELQDGAGEMQFQPQGQPPRYEAHEEPALEGTAALQAKPWRWEGFVDPVQQFDVADPDRYVLAFQPDGSILAQADCNSASGEYEAGDEGNLTIEMGPATLAACEEGSRSKEFLDNLGWVRIYFFQDGQLYMDMFADGGTLRFGAVELDEETTLADKAPLTELEQWAADLALVPVMDAEQEITTLIPKGWDYDEALDANASPDGRATVLVATLEKGPTPDQILEALGIVDPGLPDDTHKANDLAWAIWAGDGESPSYVAVAEDEKQVYVIQITADAPDLLEVVREAVLLPAIDAFAVAEPGEAVAPATTDQDQAGPVTATEVITYVPPPEAVTGEPQSGSCFSNAVGLGRDDAWRCMTEDSAMYDPCFEVESQMICNADPTSGEGGFVLELTEPLPEPQVDQLDRAWLVELEDGTVCGLLTGTVPGVGDLTAPYGCKGGTYLLGELQPGQVWHTNQVMLSVGDDGYALESSEIVPVRTVWK